MITAKSHTVRNSESKISDMRNPFDCGWNNVKYFKEAVAKEKLPKSQNGDGKTRT